MAGIFTRKAISAILNDENLTPEERTDQLFSLYGRSLDDGYVTKGAAEAAQTAAIEAAKDAWAKEQPKPNIKESAEYLELQGEFEAFRQKQTARTSDDFREIKPKFFDRVYDLIDRGENAKPVSEQLADLRKDYEEYFQAAEQQPKPTFGGEVKGQMPKGDESAVTAMAKAWGLPQK